MKRLCYVIPTMGVGGTEQQLCRLARILAGEFEVSILCTQHDGSLAGDVRRAGVYLHVLDGWSVLRGWDVRMRGKLRKHFRAHRPDIVHTFMFGFDLAANRAARDTGVPVVISSRRELATWKRPRHLRIQRKANELVDAIVANSRAVAEYSAQQEGCELSRYLVIPNGIDADAYVSGALPADVRNRYHMPAEGPIIGIVANFSPVKDHALFVASAHALLRQRPDAHFLMVGAGPTRLDSMRSIRAQGLERHFTQVSTVSEIADLYRIMDVFVLCSKVEGSPNAIMEAMAAGVPVVGAHVGGIPELIKDGVTGRLVPSREPRDFANAIASLLENPEMARDIAARAGERIRAEFSVERMAASYRELYNQMLVRSLVRDA